MKHATKMLALLLAMLMLLTACGSQDTPDTQDTPDAETDSGEFVPKLDTETAVDLNAAVFFGNFEALDQVINHFNEYYPNVTITYEQVSNSDAQFLTDDPSIDIFMTSTEKGYPEDNYDGAIMKFFEGDVPFWVCDTKKVSGMKKRESKSETFSAEPFEYEFMYAPMGDGGVYEYVELWYGFAVNKESDAQDYAVEFLRFMARQDELNTLASIKGIPSVAKETTDERYTALNEVEKVEMKVVGDGTVPAYVGTLLRHAANELLDGSIASVDDAAASFVSRCAESMQGN